MSEVTRDEWRESAARRAERLSRLIRLNAPDCIVGAEWVLVWSAMQNGWGNEVFEKAQQLDTRVRIAMQLDDESN